MARGGLYNEHAAPQHAAASFGLSAWQAAAAAVPLPPDDGTPFLIADFGAALAEAFNEGLNARIVQDPARASCHWRVFTMVIAKPG